MLSREVLYAAVKNNDARLDGKFFVGVKSTGIYCRSVCKARTPREDNCVFFETAAQAEEAGFRPCLLCRPELAPGVAPVDAGSALARRAARRIEEGREGEETLSALAQALGVSDRHLRRVFEEEYHVSPVQYRQTSRLLLAKRLLTDTDLPVTEVALAAGFQSLRRFNALFQSRYRMAPTDLRKRRRSPPQAAEQVTLELRYRPPYRWEAFLDFLKLRAIPGVEKVEAGAYLRTVGLWQGEAKHTGWLRGEHRPEKEALAVTLSASLLPVLPQVLSRVKHLFDLYCEPERVYEALQSMNDLSPGLCRPGTRLPGCFDSFEMSVRAVLGQQITVKAATTLAGRIAQRLGTPVDTGMEGLNRLFPTAEEIICGDFTSIKDYLTVTEEDFVVIMTNGHMHDFHVEEQILRGPFAYVGVIGSRTKTASVNRRLREAGIPEESIAQIHTPIGAAIQAVTPAEIAVSIAGEMILCRAERRGDKSHGCPMH